MERMVRITTAPTDWYMDVPDEWESMDEGERQDFIHETAMDCDMYPAFCYGAVFDSPRPFPPPATSNEVEK